MKTLALRRARRHVLGAALSLACTLMASTEAVADPTPDRVVTLGAHVTEIVFDLGAGDVVVGVDSSTTAPAEALRVTQVGSQRQLAIESVLATRPQLVLATDHTGPPAVLAQLRSAGVAVEVLPQVVDLSGAKTRLTQIGGLLGRQEAAATAAERLEASLSALPKPQRPVKAAFIYARGAGTLMVGGTQTVGTAMIALAGGTPAVTGYEGYKPLTAESLVSAAPEVLVVTEGGLASLGGVDGLLAAPGVKLTPAGRARRVVAVDDVALLGFGPRSAEAAKVVADALVEAAK